MAQVKEAKFRGDFRRIVVVSNGMPLSLNAEVEVTIKRPAKLDQTSQVAWNSLTHESIQMVTTELILKGE